MARVLFRPPPPQNKDPQNEPETNPKRTPKRTRNDPETNRKRPKNDPKTRKNEPEVHFFSFSGRFTFVLRSIWGRFGFVSEFVSGSFRVRFGFVSGSFSGRLLGRGPEQFRHGSSLGLARQGWQNQNTFPVTSGDPLRQLWLCAHKFRPAAWSSKSGFVGGIHTDHCNVDYKPVKDRPRVRAVRKWHRVTPILTDQEVSACQFCAEALWLEQI